MCIFCGVLLGRTRQKNQSSMKIDVSMIFCIANTWNLLQNKCEEFKYWCHSARPFLGPFILLHFVPDDFFIKHFLIMRFHRFFFKCNLLKKYGFCLGYYLYAYRFVNLHCIITKIFKWKLSTNQSEPKKKG